ncbi:MAG: DUF4474 domain-containing protein [Clostridia bacterium]|nr:DUF4474 domain-containing protein [Clostridia bacterium]
MNEFKNKSTILIIVALIVVCGGSFIGVRALSNSADAQLTSQNLTYVTESTTTTTTTSPYGATQQPVADVNLPTTNPAATTNVGIGLTSADTAITLYPMVPGAAPNTTTTTTAPTTASTTLTLPTLATNAASLTTTRNLTNATTKQNNALQDKGLAGYLFDSAGNFFFTSDDPWQRNFGYNQAFDTAAPFVSIYMDTMRLKFRYEDKDWMIQLWKGQYGLAFVGAEIGVYTKPLDREVEHYDAASDEDALYMSMTGYRHDQIIFSREYTKYWWCTGFVPGQLEKFSDRSELAVKCRITAKDENMLDSIVSELKANNLVEGKHYTVSDLDVFITWQ